MDNIPDYINSSRDTLAIGQKGPNDRLIIIGPYDDYPQNSTGGLFYGCTKLRVVNGKIYTHTRSQIGIQSLS
jgi:hypothetical protein